MKRTLLLTLSALMLSFSAQAAVINIDDNNGQQGRFQFTFETAQPGDTIVMATGEYITPWTFSITQKGIVIKAAEGAKPVVKLTDAGGWASIQLETTVTFDGITFDGNGVTKYPIYCIGKEAGTYTFKNCEFRNWVIIGFLAASLLGRDVIYRADSLFVDTLGNRIRKLCNAEVGNLNIAVLH